MSKENYQLKICLPFIVKYALNSTTNLAYFCIDPVLSRSAETFKLCAKIPLDHTAIAYNWDAGTQLVQIQKINIIRKSAKGEIPRK